MDSPRSDPRADSVEASDRLRRLAVTVTFAVCVVANLIGSGVIGSREVSTASNEAFAADASLLTPAGPAFSIWSLIYLGLAGYVVWQWLPDQASAPRHRAIGWLVVAVSLVNALWLQVALEGYLWSSVVVIALLGALLIEVLRRLDAQPPPRGAAGERWLVDGTFGAYAGWVSVALVANVAAAAAAAEVTMTGPTATRIAVAIVIGVAAIGAIIAWVGARWAVALAQGWALAWIAGGRLAGDPQSQAVGLTAVVAAVVPVLVVAPSSLPRAGRMSAWTPGWDAVPPGIAEFFAERHLATLTTLRPDGRPHLVPVGLTLDVEWRCAWVITFPASRKARNVLASPGSPVAACQVDGARWLTVEGRATATTEPAEVARAVERYAARYRQPKERPDRVAIRIEVDRIVHAARLGP